VSEKRVIEKMMRFQKVWEEEKREIIERLWKELGVERSEIMRIWEGKSEGVVVIPYCGERMEGKCIGLKYNSGLYTQCVKEGKPYCKNCEKAIEKNGRVPYGTIIDREKVGIMEYLDPSGRKVVEYSSVMKKLNISREEAESAAEKMGWKIPEIHFAEKKGKRGRPKKKDVCVSDTESEKSVEKKKRGRPRKEKEVVTNTGEDLIASLTKNINEEEEEEEEVKEVIEFTVDEKKYLKSEEGNVLYDIETHDPVGLWDENKKKIIDLPDDEY